MNETISPEECVDTFLYDVLQAEDYRIKWDKKDVFGKPSDVGLQPLCTPTDETIEEWRSEGILPTLGDVLSDEDKTLLEEYIPQLFNTINEPEKNLADAIYTLTVLVRSYRDAERERKVFEKQFDSYSNCKRSQKGREEDIKKFRTNINRIMHLLGGSTPDDKGGYSLAITLKAKPLVEALHEAYKNPDEYFLDNPKYTISKEPILNYLQSLDLPNKSKIIEEFWKKI